MYYLITNVSLEKISTVHFSALIRRWRAWLGKPIL